jgi:hypothetical protein
MGKEHFQETSVESQIPGFPGFPVGIVGAGELPAAFLTESRTRGRFQHSLAGNPGSPRDDSKESVAVDKEWLPMLRAEKIDKVTTSQDDGFTGAWDLTG